MPHTHDGAKRRNRWRFQFHHDDEVDSVRVHRRRRQRRLLLNRRQTWLEDPRLLSSSRQSLVLCNSSSCSLQPEDIVRARIIRRISGVVIIRCETMSWSQTCKYVWWCVFCCVRVGCWRCRVSVLFNLSEDFLLMKDIDSFLIEY